MKILDAVQYLKDNKFAENSQYEWINPTFRKVINDEFTDKDISDLICSISKREKEAINIAIEETSASSEKDLNISKILEISEVKNYGLLNLEEPITLNGGLNVFYGENGAGKSSLFKALCDVFGLNDLKKCIPNINNEDDAEMKCKLKIKDSEDNSLEIDGYEIYSKPGNVKIFDNYISNYIVTNDQKNEFEIAYLKQQYFYMLRSLLEEVDTELDKAMDGIESEIHDAYDVLVNDFDITDLKYKEIEHMIKGVTFTEADVKELIVVEKEKNLLETDISKVLKVSYNDRVDNLDLILRSFCSEYNQSNGDNYKLKYNANYYDEYNKNIDKYNKLKKMYEDNNVTNLNKLIQGDWIANEKWEKFIDAGINFVKALDKKEQELYTNDKCPYCNQDLEEKSRELLNIYKNIRDTQKEEIDTLERIFKSQKQELGQLITFIDELEKYNKSINEVIIDGKQDNLINIDTDELKSVFIDIYSSVENLEEIEDFNFEYCENIVDKYVEIKTLIENHIKKVSSNVENKSDEMKKLSERIEELKLKKVIYKNYIRLNKVVEDLKIVEDIINKKSQLAPLKRNLSRLENSFSSESSMKIFFEKLNDEYRDLKLTPPAQFNLKPQKEKRQVRIGRHKISDIYSEGELKIHSLAEFFAEAEINDFTGIYIFDDPVNSLDYERIGYVKERIDKLVSAGNQVIIFTHNIYFLNSLVETNSGKVNKITKANNQVYIIKNTILGEKDSEISNLGKKIRGKITLFENMDPKEVDEYDIASVYDLMSGCLESFVENKLLKGLIGRYRPNIRMFGLPELKRLDNDLIDDIYSLYNTTSRYGNRHSSPVEALKAEYSKLKDDYELFKKITELK